MITGNPASGNGGSFSGLASSALPSLGGDPLTRPTWKRSLQELAASNIALMSSNGGNANANLNGNGASTNNGGGSSSSSHSIAPPTAAAQILLGPRTDFGSLLTKRSSSNTNNNNNNQSRNSNNNHQLPSDSSSSSRFSFDAMTGNGGIEAVVRRHRDGMLERILKDQREQTQRLLDTAVERQVEDDWKEERSWWRKELVGDRNLVDATNKDNYYNPAGSSSSSRNETAGMKQRPMGSGPSNPAQGLLVADYSGGGSNKKNTMYATGCDPKTMQEHLAIVQQIQPASDQDPLQIVAGFEQLACTETFGGGYKNAWMILGSMLPRMQNNSGPIGASQGAQSHFCKQYQTIIHNHVKSASLSGQDISTPVNYGVGNISSNSMASMIASYVKLISGSNASVWEILYYCTCSVVLFCFVLFSCRWLACATHHSARRSRRWWLQILDNNRAHSHLVPLFLLYDFIRFCNSTFFGQAFAAVMRMPPMRY